MKKSYLHDLENWCLEVLSETLLPLLHNNYARCRRLDEQGATAIQSSIVTPYMEDMHSVIPDLGMLLRTFLKTIHFVCLLNFGHQLKHFYLSHY